MCRQSSIAITVRKEQAMLLHTTLLLGSVHPAFLLKVKDRDLMEGTLQKYVEDFMAYYGNSTAVRHSKAPQRIKTVFGTNWGKTNPNNATRKVKHVKLSSVDGNRSKKELSKNRQKKRKVQKRQRKTRPKSQSKGNVYIQPHGHAYEFDGAFDPFPLWEYSGL